MNDNLSFKSRYKLENLVIKNKSSLQAGIEWPQRSQSFKIGPIWDRSEIPNKRTSSLNGQSWTWTLIQGYWSISEIISMSIKYINHTCQKSQKSHSVSFAFLWGLNFWLFENLFLNQHLNWDQGSVSGRSMFGNLWTLAPNVNFGTEFHWNVNFGTMQKDDVCWS